MSIATIKPKSFPLIAIGIAGLFWCIDSYLDVFLFHSSDSFTNSLFTSDPNELWMRLSVVITLVLFSLYAKKSEEITLSLKNKIDSIDDATDELEYLETIDSLTLLFNKRKLYELLEYEMEKEKRYKAGLSIIFCRIDNYSKINQTHSQPEINNLLRNIALQLVKSLRTSDIVSRWGEDEFLVLIPNKTADETKNIAEKIRNVIEHYDFDNTGKITASFGVTQFIEDDNKVTIVTRANDAVNKAQEKGQNCVESIK